MPIVNCEEISDALSNIFVEQIEEILDLTNEKNSQCYIYIKCSDIPYLFSSLYNSLINWSNLNYKKFLKNNNFPIDYNTGKLILDINCNKIKKFQGINFDIDFNGFNCIFGSDNKLIFFDEETYLKSKYNNQSNILHLNSCTTNCKNGENFVLIDITNFLVNNILFEYNKFLNAFNCLIYLNIVKNSELTKFSFFMKKTNRKFYDEINEHLIKDGNKENIFFFYTESNYSKDSDKQTVKEICNYMKCYNICCKLCGFVQYK